MPDKKTDWTSDEAFWNDAWADMDQRLERKRRRRILLPWLFGLGLFLGAGALGVYLFNTVDDTTARPAPFAAESSSPHPDSDVPDVALNTKQPEDTRPDEVDRSESPVTATEAPRRRTPASRPPSMENRKSVSVNGYPPEVANDSAPEKNASPAPRPPAPPNRYAAAQVSRLPMAIFSLETVPQLKLPPVTLPEEAPSFTAKPVPGPYALAAGTTAYVNSFLPGGYLQFGRNFGQGDWFVPVALRYDYSRRELTVGRDEDLAEALNVTQADIATSLSNALGSRLGTDNNNLVKSHTLALRTGLGRRITARFSLAVGGEFSYIVAGNGPLIVNYGNGNYYSVRVEEERWSFSNFGSQRATQNAYYQGTTPITDELNRINANAWLNANYHIGARFALQLGLTHQITRFYQTDAFRVEPTRIELGVLRRF